MKERILGTSYIFYLSAALGVIPIYREDNLIENSEKIGTYILDRALDFFLVRAILMCLFWPYIYGHYYGIRKPGKGGSNLHY